MDLSQQYEESLGQVAELCAEVYAQRDQNPYLSDINLCLSISLAVIAYDEQAIREYSRITQEFYARLVADLMTPRILIPEDISSPAIQECFTAMQAIFDFPNAGIQNILRELGRYPLSDEHKLAQYEEFKTKIERAALLLWRMTFANIEIDQNPYIPIAMMINALSNSMGRGPEMLYRLGFVTSIYATFLKDRMDIEGIE